jgi:hypothetical protein
MGELKWGVEPGKGQRQGHCSHEQLWGGTGLDCPVEVVNARVRQQTSDWGSGVRWCEKEGPREAWDGGAEVGG